MVFNFLSCFAECQKVHFDEEHQDLPVIILGMIILNKRANNYLIDEDLNDLSVEYNICLEDLYNHYYRIKFMYDYYHSTKQFIH